jgi:hypothetical protein
MPPNWRGISDNHPSAGGKTPYFAAIPAWARSFAATVFAPYQTVTCGGRPLLSLLRRSITCLSLEAGDTPPYSGRHAILLSHRRQIRHLSRPDRIRACRRGRGDFARQAHCGGIGEGGRILPIRRRVHSSARRPLSVIRSRSKGSRPQCEDLRVAMRQAMQFPAPAPYRESLMCEQERCL